MTTTDPYSVIGAAVERAWVCSRVESGGRRRQCDQHRKLDNGPPADVSGKTNAGGPCSDARRHPLVTVEADLDLVESRLTAGAVPGVAGGPDPVGVARRRDGRGVGVLQQ